MTRTTRRRRTLAGCVAAATLLSALSAAPAQAAPTGNYVAVGDSTTSMGTATAIDFSTPETVSCGRSTDNYPRQIGGQLGLPVVDVSCAGALIDHYWHDRNKLGLIVPAQRNAISPETGLVTIQLGANPAFVNVAAPRCAGAALGSSAIAGCNTVADAVDRPGLTAQLTDVVRDARHRAAPGATIALVGYLDEIGDANASCIFTGGMSHADKQGIQTFLHTVNQVMADVAALEDVTYVAPPADGQGWCAHPGVRDVSPLGPFSGDNAFPFHPTHQGHKRLADQVVAAVR